MSRQPQAKSRSQPTPGVGNLSRRRCEAVSDSVRSARSRSETQQNQSSNSPCTLPNGQSLHLHHALLNTTGALERPAKRAWRRTIQSTTYADIKTEQDAQALTETVWLSDESSDEYQNSSGSDQTELDTEPDAEDMIFQKLLEQGCVIGHKQQTDKQTIVSREAALVRRTPAARGRIMPDRAYTPPVLLSSSVARYSFPLATHSATTSGVRSSSPAGESSMPHHKPIWPNTLSWRNTAKGAEVAVVSHAKALILWYTLFVDPLPDPVTLTSQVHPAWLEALHHISDTGNMEASEENIKIIRSRHSGVRSQFVSHVKDDIRKLYDLPEDPTAIARKVDYLLEKDRFMCSPNGYEVGVR
ncbi:hypothetical protein B9Z19DRAFT_1060675 [Tuber borchii]|uniref:DUF6532 domain-containing protein n=1 Tax=Tuber borchii TaxID=42251 RepID=A0A2T7A7M5_TUBBO|nr:hypothetical protein B9Z19DRAFT_1060675 [Tuber borchii]